MKPRSRSLPRAPRVKKKSMKEWYWDYVSLSVCLSILYKLLINYLIDRKTEICKFIYLFDICKEKKREIKNWKIQNWELKIGDKTRRENHKEKEHEKKREKEKRKKAKLDLNK